MSTGRISRSHRGDADARRQSAHLEVSRRRPTAHATRPAAPAPAADRVPSGEGGRAILSRRRVVGFHVALAVAHVVAVGVVLGVHIRFPITVFETRMRSDVLDDFKCVYEYGVDADGQPFCESPRDWIDRDACAASLRAYVNASHTHASVNANGGPAVDAYELRRLGGQNADDVGRGFAKALLVCIEATTAAAHVLYAFRVHHHGRTGAARWYEYAVTSPLMNIYLANVATVYDLNTIVAIVLATFSLMFCGYWMQRTIVDGDCDLAALVFWVPSMPLFTVAWVPMFRQLRVIGVLSCVSGDDWLTCEKTCFGREVPVPLFVFLLFGMYLVFPLISLDRLYRAVECPRRRVHFLCVTIWAAARRVVCDIALDHGDYRPFLTPKERASLDVEIEELWTEVLFGLASALSKLFLTSYFLIVFATRRW